MSEFQEIHGFIPEELQDLADLRAESSALEAQVRDNNFSDKEESIKARLGLLSHLRREFEVATKEEVQDRVAALGNLCFQQLVELRVGSEIREADGIEETEEYSEAEAASSHWFSEVYTFMKRYGARTPDMQRLRDKWAIKLGAGAYQENPMQELLPRTKLTLQFYRHYIVDGDGNMTRIHDNMAKLDSQEEERFKRSIEAVHEAENGLSLPDLFVSTFGKRKAYDESLLTPIIEKLQTIPANDEQLVVVVDHGENGNEDLRVHINPNVELSVVKLEQNDDKDFETDPDKAFRQLENLCVIASYFQGFNLALEKYGFQPITDKMLKDLENHIPYNDQNRGVEIMRRRKMAIDEVLQDTNSVTALVEFVYNINDMSRELEDDAAEAASELVKLTESAKGRELIRLLDGAVWDSTSTLRRGMTKRDRVLRTALGREIYPTTVELLES